MRRASIVMMSAAVLLSGTLVGAAKIPVDPPVIRAVHTYQPGALEAFGTDTQYTLLTITGAHFTGTTQVKIGSVLGVNVKVINDGQIDVAVPPRPATEPVDTPVSVAVATGAGTGDYSPGFMWVSTTKIPLGQVVFNLPGQYASFGEFACPADHPYLARVAHYPDGTADLSGIGVWPANNNLSIDAAFMNGANPYPYIGWFRLEVTNNTFQLTAALSALCTDRFDNEILPGKH